MIENDYIKNNSELLKLLDKTEAVLLFAQQQPEKKQIDSLKQEIEQLQTRLKSNEEQKNKLQGCINYLSDEHKKQEFAQKKELGQAKQFCDKRDKMLVSSPPSLRKKAAEQFKSLSQYQDEFNTKIVKPEKISDSAGFFTKLLYGKKLKEFDAQFENIRKDIENGKIGNFDTSSDFDRIGNDINKKYDSKKEQLQTQIAEKQKELISVDDTIQNDKRTLQTKENSLTQNEKSLQDKVGQFSAVYDSHPFIDNSYVDPVVQKALDKGQILGSEREVQILASLLTKGCQNSDIAKEVLYAAFDTGTKYIISEQASGVGGKYSGGVVSIGVNLLNHLDTDTRKVETISTLIHESRHACQDTGENIVKDNWANTFVQSSLQEVDAYSIQTAAIYQMNQKLVTNAGEENMGDGHKYMLKAFAKEYEQSHDVSMALNEAALEWDQRYGYGYKTKQYIHEDWCHLKENAETIHPEEIAKRNNITYQGQPYLDIRKITEQILTIDKSDYDEITQKLELSGEKDDSMQYFSVKNPEFRKDEKGNILQDEYGFNIIDYKITPPAKQFAYSSKSPQPELNDGKVPFNDMPPQRQSYFIQKELRQGINSRLNTNVSSTVPTKEKTTEKGKIVTPLIKISKGMEM